MAVTNGLGDRVHQRRGDELEPPVALEEADHAQLMLQLGLVQVQVQPVDALKLEGHMLVEHVCGGSGYRHLVAPVDRAALTANGRFGDECTRTPIR